MTTQAGPTVTSPTVTSPTGTAPAAAAWFAAGEEVLLRHLDRLTAADLRGPSLLPGWTRAHVLAHLAGNAAALGNLVHWARTGVPTPMYADAAARAEQIERDARLPLDALTGAVRATSADLLAGYAALTGEQLRVRVRTAQGRDRAAAEVAWMRTRESSLHLVDLDVGHGVRDLPPDLVDALLTDAAATVGAKTGVPVLLAPTDRGGRTWTVGDPGPGGAAGVTRVAGPAADLLAYLVGRPAGGDDVPSDRPPLPAWL